jgi:hypothetical protein
MKRRKNLTIRTGIYLLLALFSFSIEAQVTIGDNKPPYDISALELISSDNTDKPRGLRMPLLTTGEISTLKTQIRHIQSAGKEPSGSNTIQNDWAEKEACGLTVFNTDTQCMEIWNGEEQKFKSLCGAVENCEVEPIDCDQAHVFPDEGKTPYILPYTKTGYEQDQLLNGNESYIKILVKVSKPGAYTAIAKPNPANGYSFSAKGEWTNTGLHYLILRGEGMPIKGGKVNGADIDKHTDNVELYFNGNYTGCVKEIDVAPPYLMAKWDCDFVKISSHYIVKNQPLYAMNEGYIWYSYIDYNYIQVEAPGHYYFTLEGANMKYMAEGIFNSSYIGRTSIRLNPVRLSDGNRGKPLVAGLVEMTFKGWIRDALTGELIEKPVCDNRPFRINVAYPAIALGSYGASYRVPAETTAAGKPGENYTASHLINGEYCFDPVYGQMPVLNISVNKLTSITSTTLTGKNVVVAAGSITGTSATALSNWIKNGGIAIVLSTDPKPIIKALTGVTTTTGTNPSSADHRFVSLNSLSSEYQPLLNLMDGSNIGSALYGHGVFYKITGALSSIGATALSTGNEIVVIKKEKGYLIWIGNSDFAYGNTGTTNTMPCRYQDNGRPAFGGAATLQYRNAHFFANCIGWAIQRIHQ